MWCSAGFVVLIIFLILVAVYCDVYCIRTFLCILSMVLLYGKICVFVICYKIVYFRLYGVLYV
nr:MAG TPA: hypothetical protein [Caudoviricetes sp.]